MQRGDREETTRYLGETRLLLGGTLRSSAVRPDAESEDWNCKFDKILSIKFKKEIYLYIFIYILCYTLLFLYIVIYIVIYIYIYIYIYFIILFFHLTQGDDDSGGDGGGMWGDRPQ